jgi:hypothetical protein
VSAVDVWELRGRIAARGHTVTSLAENIGISRNTLAKYLGHPDMMTYNAMSKIIDTLDMDSNQVMAIFFADKLTFNERKK